MKLPNAENAYVEERKITAYLLDPEHEEGGSKARFFLAFGSGRRSGGYSKALC